MLQGPSDLCYSNIVARTWKIRTRLFFFLRCLRWATVTKYVQNVGVRRKLPNHLLELVWLLQKFFFVRRRYTLLRRIPTKHQAHRYKTEMRTNICIHIYLSWLGWLGWIIFFYFAKQRRKIGQRKEEDLVFGISAEPLRFRLPWEGEGEREADALGHNPLALLLKYLTRFR